MPNFSERNNLRTTNIPIVIRNDAQDDFRMWLIGLAKQVGLPIDTIRYLVCQKTYQAEDPYNWSPNEYMENEIYSILDGEPLPEVGKTRLAEYKAIKKKVDAKAERLTRKELNMPKGEWWFGSCHTFWKHKKKILREEYHMIWRSPQDLNPETCFD